MRVVVDTNVFVSSFFGGKPRKIIDLWKTGKITLCLSDKIIDEYIEVLKRLGLQNEKELEDLLVIFSRGFNIIFTHKTPILDIVKDDPDDNNLIDCVVELKCPYIVSGDKHLKNIKKYMEIEIVSPKDFLDMF